VLEVDRSCTILRPATCPLYSAADLLGVPLQALQRAPLSSWLEVRPPELRCAFLTLSAFISVPTLHQLLTNTRSAILPLLLLQVGSSSSGLLLDSAAGGGKSKGALKRSKAGVQVGPHKVVKGRLGCGLPTSFNLQVTPMYRCKGLAGGHLLTHAANRLVSGGFGVGTETGMGCLAGCHQGRHWLGQAGSAGHL
jgi:hypothetical protein